MDVNLSNNLVPIKQRTRVLTECICLLVLGAFCIGSKLIAFWRLTQNNGKSGPQEAVTARYCTGFQGYIVKGFILIQ